VLVLDRSRPLEDIDCALLRETTASPRIVVVNKIDLPPVWTAEELDEAVLFPGEGPPGAVRTGPAAEVVMLSLKRGEGLAALRAAIHAALDVAEPLRDAPIVTNVRHETLLRRARESVARAMVNLDRGGESASEELVLADLADARAAVEEVTGKRTTEDLLRRIFERFCVGK
jgi:tRNA modification GTPase